MVKWLHKIVLSQSYFAFYVVWVVNVNSLEHLVANNQKWTKEDSNNLKLGAIR
jgi:hypothetical protein